MHLPSISFHTLDWNSIPKEIHEGETGNAYWQTRMFNDIRVRRVEYSAGYKANHWCSKGHIIFCIEGEMNTELIDGRIFRLSAGMCYFVGDNNEAHRSFTQTGCQLFVVD